MENKWMCYAACSFGLEAVVARELERLGAENIHARDARVYFSADLSGIARANLWLTAADRVYIVLKEFMATTFDELFEGVKAMPWEEWLSKDARFPVAGDSVRSVLKSVPDIQSISKKAIVEALRRAYGLRFYKESGRETGIYIHILKDQVSVCLNASGAGLNRRGYRVKNGPAPLRETLAAGLIDLTRWRDRPFYDIMCGSGTIAIEAAMRAKGQAPGIRRAFAAQHWSDEWERAFALEREAARSREIENPGVPIFASDIDDKMVEMARFHARRAGVESMIHFSAADAACFSPVTEEGTLLSNPPYAMRLGEEQEVKELYAALGRSMKRIHGFRYYFLSADADFERKFGRQADKKRKLYNGNIKCTFYQYFKDFSRQTR